MAFKIRRTGHLVLRVKDLDLSKRFFTEVLGLPQTGDPGWILLTALWTPHDAPSGLMRTSLARACRPVK